MKTKEPSRLAIALQTWEGDCEIALRLTRLITSIEPKRRDDIEFIVSARRGTPHTVVAAIMHEAAQKFSRGNIIEGQRFGDGWPQGCNALWCETMVRVHQLKKAGQIKATGVLTLEPDCLPLNSDWLSTLANWWRSCEIDGLDCTGTFVLDSKGEPNHINGNAIFRIGLQKDYPELNGADDLSGWDTQHRKLLMGLGTHTHLIAQRYAKSTITREEIDDIRKQSAMLHGIKGEDGLEIIESMVKSGEFNE